LPVSKPVTRDPVDWNVLYQFRDNWRAYRKAVADTKHETRFGGLRSIFLFTLMSGALVGMLVAGVFGGA
jgi:phage terminase small subunit